MGSEMCIRDSPRALLVLMIAFWLFAMIYYSIRKQQGKCKGDDTECNIIMGVFLGTFFIVFVVANIMGHDTHDMHMFLPLP